MPDGRTHFVGDDCEGGHWSDIPAGAKLVEAQLDADIPSGREPAHYIGICAGPSVGETEPSAWIPVSRLAALKVVAETLKEVRRASHPPSVELEMCPCMTCTALLGLRKTEAP